MATVGMKYRVYCAADGTDDGDGDGCPIVWSGGINISIFSFIV